MVKSIKNSRNIKKNTSLKKSNKSKYFSNSLASGINVLKNAKNEEGRYKDAAKKGRIEVLKRLFTDKNLKVLEDIPKNELDYDNFAEVLKKGITRLDKLKPNEDYYDYVNNDWLTDTEKKLKTDLKYYVEVDDFRVVQDKVYGEVLAYTNEYIKENKGKRKAESIKAIQHCITKADKKLGLKHAKIIKETIEEHIIKDDMYGLLAYSNQDEIFAWQAPIVWSILPDEKNVKKYISHLSPPQLGIYDYFVYIEDENDDDKKKKYKKEFKEEYFKFIRNTFKTVLPDEWEKYDPNDIWKVELQLLDAMGCDKIKKEDPDYYNVVTKDELENDYGFDWTRFTQELGNPSIVPKGSVSRDVKFEKTPNRVIVSSLNALKCTTELLKKNWNTVEWKTWWMFIFYKQIIRFDYDWTDVYYQFYGKFIKGQPVRMPKETYSIFPLSFCYNTFLTEQYVAHNFDPIKTIYVENMVADLKEVFIRKIGRNTWLSPSTKKSALEKLRRLKIIVGSPEKLREDAILTYKEKDPWYNMTLISAWRRKKLIGLEGKGVIDIPEIDWNAFKLVGTQAYMVNAYYMPTSNTIYCPLAYLQKPFIDLDQRGIEYNLAYIGYTMAHELSHSLDDMGSKFDADGNLNNWWTDADRKKFDEKIKDVVKQYEEFAARDGIEFDAEIGVGEDLADISGLSLAEEYLFYFQAVHNDTPLINTISLKAFYIYGAIQSRQKIFDSALPAQLKQNPHPLEKYRCNCPLTRLKLFRDLYEVKKGDGMWWHNTDTIW
jgi:predicted metalloendopeptidase